MFGILLNEQANVFYNDEAVYKNSAFAESQLKKKKTSVDLLSSCKGGCRSGENNRP